MDFDHFLKHDFVVAASDVFLSDDIPEAGPAGAGVEFSFGGEERVGAADAAEEAGVVELVIGSGEGSIGVLAAGDIELFGGELLAPFGVGLDDSFEFRGAESFAGVIELDDSDVVGLGGGLGFVFSGREGDESGKGERGDEEGSAADELVFELSEH